LLCGGSLQECVCVKDELRWRDVKLPFDVYIKIAECYVELNEPFYAHNMVCMIFDVTPLALGDDA
jgi:hypothetical protein